VAVFLRADINYTDGMKGVVFVVVASIVVIGLVFGVAVYVSNLDQEAAPQNQTEKRGRARYLLETRWPKFYQRQTSQD